MKTEAHQNTKPGTPGRKWLRKLDAERVAIANHNSKNPRFQDKFSHPAKDRISAVGLPANPWIYLLRQWRDKKNLTTKEAAYTLGIPVDTYRGWEKGKHAPTKFTRDEIRRRISL